MVSLPAPPETVMQFKFEGHRTLLLRLELCGYFSSLIKAAAVLITFPLRL